MALTPDDFPQYMTAAEIAICGHALSREAGDDVTMAAALVLDILSTPWPTERFTTFKGLSLEAAARLVADRVLIERAELRRSPAIPQFSSVPTSTETP